MVRTDIKHADDTYCGTKIQLNMEEERRKGTTQVKCKGMKKAEMHLVTYEDGTEVQRDQGNWESCSAKRGESQIGVWEVRNPPPCLQSLGNLNQAMQTKFFIESPPLAGIFAECEWMDWVRVVSARVSR